MNASVLGRRVLAVAGAVLLATGLAAPAAAAPTSGIHVTVVNSDSSEADGTCVSIHREGDTDATSICDQPGGVYYFPNLEPGLYYILSAYNNDEEYNQFYDGAVMYADATPVDLLADSIVFRTFELSATPYLFSDVGASHTFYHAIAKLAGEQTVGGFEDGTFRPGVAVTRQAFAAFVARVLMDGYLYDNPDEFVPAGQTFPDVAPTHPFYAEIELLAEAGIAGGYGDGTYQPGAPITRQAAAAFLYRIAELLDDPEDGVDWFGGFTPGDGPDFSDVGELHPFYDEINWLAWAEIADGYSDGSYRSGATVTRQAMASFLYKFFAVEGYY